jgi:poly-gamma-glutamate synthesis protein (capsule biosynthesis protein)
MATHLRGLVDAVGCANNVHYGPAIVHSLQRLDDLGIQHAGAGCDRTQARRPAIVERAGLRVGLLAFTSVFTPIGAAADGAPGVATIRARTSYEPHPRTFEMPGISPIVHSAPDEQELAAACEDVRSLREQVDLTVVYCHWGVTATFAPTEYQQTIGHALIDAGAHLVVGSHPHRAQGVERYGGGVVFYSLGNFVFGWKLHRDSTRDGLLARVAVDQGRCVRVSVVPVARNERGSTELLATDAGHGGKLARHVVELSAELGTELRVEDGELVV